MPTNTKKQRTVLLKFLRTSSSAKKTLSEVFITSFYIKFADSKIIRNLAGRFRHFK